MNYQIEKCKSKDDYDNGCYQPSDGGQYSKEDALRILENGNGGSMKDSNNNSFSVGYKKSDNDWLRKKLKIN